jgi:hypothetical protein
MSHFDCQPSKFGEALSIECPARVDAFQPSKIDQLLQLGGREPSDAIRTEPQFWEVCRLVEGQR